MFKIIYIWNNYIVKDKEYILNAKKVILNRVRFHAPITYSANIDKTKLFNFGIDLRYPVFVFNKQLNKNLVKAFAKASEEENFNLVINQEKITKKQEKILKNIKNCVFFDDKNTNLEILNMINKLNINYFSSSNYNFVFKDKFVKIDNEILNPTYKEFSLGCQNCLKNGVEYSYKEFLLNGNNIFIKLKNLNKNEQKIEFSLNFPLKKGYFYFKKINNAIKITNLINNESYYFSFVCPNAKFSFSAIDGLDNSYFSTIYLKLNFNLKPEEEENFFFLFSNKKLPEKLKTKKCFEKLCLLSLKKCQEIFDLKVKTKNLKFDQFFNNELPKKIWLGWNLKENVDDLILKYMNLRRLFIKGKEKIDFVPFKEIGLKELGIFNGEYYKKILVSFGREKYLSVGKVKYANISNVTRYSLRKKDTIFLSFDR